jgi:hypothetical protein
MSHDSGSVDGQIVSTHVHSPWVGDGWSTPPTSCGTFLAEITSSCGRSASPSLQLDHVASLGTEVASDAWAPMTNTVVAPLCANGGMALRNYAGGADAAIHIGGYFVGGQAAAATSAATPVGQWKFDEGTGTRVGDSAGSRPVTTLGGTGWTAGVNGQAGRLDGTSGYAVSGEAGVSSIRSRVSLISLGYHGWAAPRERLDRGRRVLAEGRRFGGELAFVEAAGLQHRKGRRCGGSWQDRAFVERCRS